MAPLPIGVNHPGITAHDGRVYLLGGNLGDDRKSNRLYRYDPGGDRWKRLADAPTARAAMAFAAIGDRLYAAGGYTADDLTVQRLEIYDVGRDRWRAGSRRCRPGATMSAPRCSRAASWSPAADRARSTAA